MFILLILQVVLQRSLPGGPEEDEEDNELKFDSQHIQLAQIVLVFILILAVWVILFGVVDKNFCIFFHLLFGQTFIIFV